jgi:uncharacterized protein YjaG (DUF416 family)
MEPEFDSDALVAELRKLSSQAVLAFALSCAERLLPNYRAFHREHGWGEPGVLREALDVGWLALRGQPSEPARLDALKARCEAAAPDTEDFHSRYVSPGLDAASAAYLVMDLLRRGDAAAAADIASLCRDTVDMYVQELEGMEVDDPELEEKILKHPLMQRELVRQRTDLERLRSERLSGDAVARLESDWRAPARSNIELSG